MLVDKDGYLKLTDFGLSRIVNRKIEKHEAFTDLNGKICGTPEYMAPELLKRQGFSQASEYWSFGCLLYEMLVGVPPFLNTESELK